MIKLPRLLDSSMKEIARLEPVSLSMELSMAPLSTATMVLPEGQGVQAGAYVELFTPHGSAGIFRTQQVTHDFAGTDTVNLEHGLVTLNDGLIPGTLEEEKTSTAKEVLTEILKHQSAWKLGVVAVPDDKKLTWSYDYSNLLESLMSILDRLPEYMLTYDQTEYPWTLNLVAVPPEVKSECRLTRNISSLSVESDRSQLCTRLHLPDINETVDADTLGKWGVVEKTLTGDEGLTEEELVEQAEQYLDQHKDPILTISIDGLDLSKATGETLDEFVLGSMCRVCLPEYDQTIDQRIVSLSYPDLVADEENVRLTLANASETTADVLAGLIVDTTVQRRLIYKNGQELDRLVVRVITNEDAISIITPKLDILALEVETQGEKITDIAGRVDINTGNISGVLQELDGINERYAAMVGDITRIDGTVETITGSTLWMTRDSITGVVGKMSVGDDGKIYIQEGSGLMVYENGTAYGLFTENSLTAGLLVEKLNDGSTSTKIKADVINLEGYVTMKQFEAAIAEIESGWAEYFYSSQLNADAANIETLSAGDIDAASVEASVITVGGDAVATQAWVDGKSYATQSYVTTVLKPYALIADIASEYLKKSALKTEEIEYVYQASLSKEYDNVPGADGVGHVVLSSATLTYNTAKKTIVVYA